MDLKAELEMQAPPSEIIFGMAKKFTLELEKYPLHTQSAVISMMNMMAQHRKAAMDMAAAQEQQKARDEAMADAQRAHDRQRDERARQMAKDAGLVLA